MLGQIFGFFSSFLHVNIFNNKRSRDTIIEVESYPVPNKRRRLLENFTEEYSRENIQDSQKASPLKDETDSREFFRTPPINDHHLLKGYMSQPSFKFEKTSPYKKSCRPPNHCKSPEKAWQQRNKKMAFNAEVKKVTKGSSNERNIPPIVHKIDLTLPEDNKIRASSSRNMTLENQNKRKILSGGNKHKRTNFFSSKSYPHSLNVRPNMSRLEYSQVLGTVIKHNSNLSKISSPNLSTISQPVEFVDLSSDGGDDNSFEIISESDKENCRGLIDLTKSRTSQRASHVSAKTKTEVVDLTGSVHEEMKKALNSPPCLRVSLDSVETSDYEIEEVYNKKVQRVNSFDKNIVQKNQYSSTKWIDKLNAEYFKQMEQFEKEVKVKSSTRDQLNTVNSAHQNDWLTNRFLNYLSLTEYVVTLEKEPEPTVFPELTPEMKELIHNAFMAYPEDEVLVTNFNYSIRRRDIGTLKGLNWLNDEVINFYMVLIMERAKKEEYFPVFSFNTFFYPRVSQGGHSAVKRWTKKDDLFAYDLILVPVHLQMHWCMAVIDLKKKEIKYFDSMGTNNDKCLEVLLQYIIDERKVKKGDVWKYTDWKLENASNIPQQKNGSDCGVFACTFAEFTSRRSPFTFSQKEMQYLREKMVYEIVTSSLLL